MLPNTLGFPEHFSLVLIGPKCSSKWSRPRLQLAFIYSDSSLPGCQSVNQLEIRAGDGALLTLYLIEVLSRSSTPGGDAVLYQR